MIQTGMKMTRERRRKAREEKKTAGVWAERVGSWKRENPGIVGATRRREGRKSATAVRGVQILLVVPGATAHEPKTR